MKKASPAAMATVRKARIYPFLFSAYPVLFLYLKNIREVLPIQALLALAISLCVAGFFWIVLQLAVRRTGKRALLLFLIVLIFHSYGLYFDLILGWLPVDLMPLQAHAIGIVLPAVVFFLLARALLRSGENLAKLERIVQLAVILLVSWNLLGILVHHGRSYFSRGRLPWENTRPAPMALCPTSLLP